MFHVSHGEIQFHLSLINLDFLLFPLFKGVMKVQLKANN